MTQNTTTDDATDDGIETFETTIGGCWNGEMEELATDIKQCVDGDPNLIEVVGSKNRIGIEWVDDDSPFVTISGGIISDHLPAGVSVDSIHISSRRVSVILDVPALDYIA